MMWCVMLNNGLKMIRGKGWQPVCSSASSVYVTVIEERRFCLTAAEVEDDGLGELFEPAALPCLGGGGVELVELEPEDYPDFLCQVLGAGLAVVAVAASVAGKAPADAPHRGAVAAHEGAVGVVPGGVGCHHFLLFIVV